jgi:hypothetical protein
MKNSDRITELEKRVGALEENRTVTPKYNRNDLVLLSSGAVVRYRDEGNGEDHGGSGVPGFTREMYDKLGGIKCFHGDRVAMVDSFWTLGAHIHRDEWRASRKIGRYKED